MPNVVFVTSYGCTPCLRVKRILKELQAEMPSLSVEEVEFKSSSGWKLSIENGILYPPAVFLNGELLAKGKIDGKDGLSYSRTERGISIMSLLLLAYVIAAFVAGVIALAMPCCFSVLLPAYFSRVSKRRAAL